MLIFRYTDVDIGRRHVQTGYRLVLIYNLFHSKTEITPLAARLNHAQQDLNDILGKWEQERAFHPELAPRYLVYMLERPLGNSDLRLESLRGDDHLKACQLMTACQTRGLCFFLATMKYSVARYLDESNDDEDHCPCCLQYAKDVLVWDDGEERNYSLMAIVTAHGQQIARNITTDTLSVIQDQVVGPSAEPEQYDLVNRAKKGVGLQYDGDSDRDVDQRGLMHAFHRHCVVLIPRAFRFDFLLNGKDADIGYDVWIDIVLQEIENESLSLASKKELKELCSRIGTSNQIKSFFDAFERVVAAALRLNDPDLFENTLKALPAETLPLTVFGKVGQSMAELNLDIWQQRFVSDVSK